MPYCVVGRVSQFSAHFQEAEVMDGSSDMECKDRSFIRVASNASSFLATHHDSKSITTKLSQDPSHTLADRMTKLLSQQDGNLVTERIM